MNVFAPFIRRPIGSSLLAAGLFLAGALAYQLLGVAALPAIDAPAVMVQASMPGANAQTMASTIIAPLERHLGQIPGVDQMYSSTNEGAGFIQVRFNFGRPTDKAARDVQAAINAAVADLPAGMPSPPQYFKFDTTQIPVLLVAVTSRSMPPDKLFDTVDTLVRPAVSQIDGVARVQVFGGTAHAVRVELDTNALAAKKLTANDVSNALVAANVNAPQGTLSDGRTQMTVIANDGMRTADEFGKILIAMRDGVPVRLSDIARVYSGQEDQYQAAWFQGQRSVTMQISKRPEANAIATAQAIRDALPRFHAILPADAEITPIFDLTQTTQSALHEVKVALMISVVMVCLVMLVFLRRLGPTLIATLSVPLSLAGAFVIMWGLGYTLNTMSLMALVLCIGFVVDDAIVVIENIVRHMEQGDSPMAASLKGVREIGFTVISITISLVAVFAPLLFGNNLLVTLLREFSVTLAAAVLISAVISLTITPALCARFLKHDAPDRKVSWVERKLERFDQGFLHVYQKGLDWAMRHRRLMRWQPVILLCLTVVLAIAVVKTAGGNFMPEEDTGQMRGEIAADANVSPDEMTRRLTQVGEIMRADPAVADVSLILGGDTGGAVGSSGLMFVDLKPKGHGPGERPDDIKVVMQRLSKQYEKLPHVQVFLNPLQFLGGGGGNSNRGQYSFQLISTNGETLQPWVLKVVREMRGMKEFRDVGSDFDVVGKQQMLQVDRDAASRLHVGMGMVDSALYNAFGQRPVSVIYSDINQYRVVLTAAAAQTLSPEALLNTYVKNTQGTMIPLSAVAHIAPVTTPVSVTHQDQLESADITYNLAPKLTPDKGNALVQQALHKVNLPDGVQMNFTGTSQRLRDAQSNGMVLLIGAIAAVYIVLGILYESLGHPLTILSTLPAAGAGAFLAMLVTQQQLTLMAIISILLLIGIVKKNAILMVDFALTAQREHGMSPVEAIRQAALVRFRPITMTTLVAMGAALPLAIGFGVGSEMRRPLGIAIVGGLLVSQLLTLLSTPAIYLWNHDRKERKARRKHRRMLKRRYKAWLALRKARRTR